MNTIDSNQQFQYEFIAGISLSNRCSPQLHRANTNIDTRKDRPIFHNKQPQSFNEPIDNKQLEVIGLEFGPKNNSIQQSCISIGSKLNISRVNQTMLQLPKRTTFIAGRRAQENVLPRTWTARVPISSSLLTTSKCSIASPHPRSNTSTDSFDDKLTMPQRSSSSLNASIAVIKKLPSTDNQLSPRSSKKSQPIVLPIVRETTTIKLPTLVKRTSTTLTKPIPSAYIQDLSRIHVPSTINTNRKVLQPTPILPVYSPHRSVTLINAQPKHLSLFKDRMIKATLAQKASFKCKSPLPYRPESSLSRSTTAVLTASQLQIRTNNPLKQTDLNSILNETTRNRLKRLFQQLDTDQDGHLTYPQVQKCLPGNLPRAQQTFFRVLYDITSDITYFGLQEFFTTAVLIDLIGKQNSNIWNTLLDDVDFNYYRDDIVELLEEYDKRCSPVTLSINFDNLVSLIMNRTTNGKYEQIAKELEISIPMIKTIKLIRLEFIALIPLIIYIESCFDQGKSLFRFRDNSLLDLYMQRELFI